MLDNNEFRSLTARIETVGIDLSLRPLRQLDSGEDICGLGLEVCVGRYVLGGSGLVSASKSTPVPNVWASLDTKTTRGVNAGVAAARSLGASSFVKRNGPTWSVASWVSRPSGVTLKSTNDAAALLINTYEVVGSA